MSAGITDYEWWRRWRPRWADAHCVTLVSDHSPESFIAALGSTPGVPVHGIDAFYEHAIQHSAGGYDPSRALIGVAETVSGWVLVAEINGYVGVTERLIGPISTGRTIVSHFRNVNAVNRFNWWHDGQLLVDFDLLFPDERWGADPDVLVPTLRDVGVPLDAEPEEVAGIDLSAAGFALAERITTVVCTPELFEESDFRTGIVAMPDNEELDRYGQALRATWRHPTSW